MAAATNFIWSFLFLLCLFQASDGSRRARTTWNLFRHKPNPTENPEFESIIAQIPTTTVPTCADMKEQLSLLDRQLQQKTDDNSQLENEAFGMRRELRALNLQLATCSSTASAITDSYQTHLQNKLKNLLNTFDSDAFLILKVTALTREVHSLQKRIEHANSTADTEVLQSELQVKTDELHRVVAQMNMQHTEGPLIAEIVLLQNQIWDLEQEEIRRGEKTSQPNRQILALQAQLDEKISELQKNNNTASALLSLVSVNSKIANIQKLLSAVVEQSRSGAADHRRQWKQKVELLKKKISELNQDESNTQLTREILALQLEVDNLRDLMLNSKKTTESQLKELRNILEQEKKHQDKFQKVLEEEDYPKAQTVMKIITMMKELRELQAAEKDQTTTKPETSQATTLQALLETKEVEYAKAQDEISKLQRELELKSKECSGPEEKHEDIKTLFEKNIAELNRTGDPKAAAVLSILNLHDDLKTLRGQISASKDPERTSELKNQLEEKQEELNLKTDVIERLFPNPNIILTIIELLGEIWEHQDSATNDASISPVLELENTLDGLISKINGEEITKLILQIVTLNTQLADLQIFQTNDTTQLRNNLEAKRQELQKQINELKEKNEPQSDLILKVTDQYNKLRHPEREKPSDGQMSATITELRQQLRANEEERSRDQAEIRSLQDQLNQTEAQCSGYEQNLKDLQNDLDTKVKELSSKSDTISSLALQISTLTQQLEDLKKQLRNTASESKIKELQKLIDEKTAELDRKTEELKARSAQPQRILQIIALQAEIEKLANVAENSTDYNKITALQDQMNYLIEGVQDEDNDNTKLMFQILAQQDEIARLKKQEESQTRAELKKIKDLEDDLEDIRNQIQEKTLLLDTSDLRIANLSSQIMELHKKIQPLEDEISDLKEAHSENLEELQKRLNLSKRQLQDSELRLKDADAKNFQSVMEITDLKAKLKQAQRQGSKADKRKVNELEAKIQTQQKENRKLENTNKDLMQEVLELKKCCSVDTKCDDLQRQLQQSQIDADRLQQQLTDKDANLKQLQEQLENQIRENKKLQDDNKSLQAEKNKLEHDNQNQQNQQTGVENEIHAKKVTADPNTAHRRIYLSNDNTVMTTGGVPQSVVDHPGRFDLFLAVLGSSGFSSGRHYWEVSVAGRPCYHVGMASGSASRRGLILFRPSDGYWTILLDRQGHYKAVDSTVVTLPVHTHPLTLGILVEYNKGQISFYDAGARTHIYSFVGQTFSDTIFPFINFCVEISDSQVPIALRSPGSVDWIK